MSQWYVPRLEKTIKFQKELSDELQHIREDAELLPSMFRQEAADRDRIRGAKDKAEEDAREALANKGRLLKEIDDLRSERDRKKQLSIQAIAARSNVKQHLDEATAKIAEQMRQLEIYAKQLQEAEVEKNDAIEKHDEMFNSVSSLNQRIEELETHKLHLLSKLKNYGDKGGLEYIVKT